MSYTFLSDAEKNRLSSFLDDPIMVEAVKKVLFKPVYTSGVLIPDAPANGLQNFALNIYKNPSEGSNEQYSDEELGRLTKIRRLAVELVITAFNEMENYRGVTKVGEEKSKVRK